MQQGEEEQEQGQDQKEEDGVRGGVFRSVALHGENLKAVPGSRLCPYGAAEVGAEQAGGVKRGGVGGGSALLPAPQCAANARRRAFCERKH